MTKESVDTQCVFKSRSYPNRPSNPTAQTKKASRKSQLGRSLLFGTISLKSRVVILRIQDANVIIVIRIMLVILGE